MFTFTMPTEAMRAYAASRDLSYAEDGLLPPISSVLRAGLGEGPKRAAVITSETAHGYSARGGFAKHPERATRNLCQGALPGGLQGAIGHHQHVELRSGGGDDGPSWHVATDTVVVARLPERSRALCELNVFPGAPGEMTALGSADLSGGRAPIDIHVIGRMVETRGPHTFDINPAEDRATLDAVASDAVLAALARAPWETRVELVDGVVCVSAPGIIENPDALDALCAVATGIAAGVRATVVRHGDLDAGAPLASPPATPRQQWLDAGVARVDWSARPPASVHDARAAYERVVGARAEGSGRRARGAILALGLAGCVLCFGASYWFTSLYEPAPWAVCVASVLTLVGVWKTVRAAFEAGEEVRADEVGAQAGPWALEAFARGYAQARGLRLEDPDVFRHQLASPVGGKALRVIGGDLGGGVFGHVALWRDWVASTHWLIAAVPAGAGAGPAAAPYRASVAGDVLLLGRQVAEAQRSAAELDRLIAEARRLAGRRAVSAAAAA